MPFIPPSAYQNPASPAFPTLSEQLRPQFQGFGAPPQNSAYAPPNTEQSNTFQPLSYYQQRYQAANNGLNNGKTNNAPQVTLATVSEYSAPDKHTRIFSSFPKIEKAFRILCSIRQSDKIIGL